MSDRGIYIYAVILLLILAFTSGVVVGQLQTSPAIQPAPTIQLPTR